MPTKKKSLTVEKRPNHPVQEPGANRPDIRPKGYKSRVKDRLDEVEAWAKAGATRLEIAQNLGVSRCSLFRYQNRHPEFAEALSRGDQVVVAQVEAALFRSAVGYHLDVEEVIEEEVFHMGRLAGVKKRIKRSTKHVAPNERAARMILNNRAPRVWTKARFEPEGEASQPGAMVIPAVAATPEDWEQMVKAQSSPKPPKPRGDGEA